MRVRSRILRYVLIPLIIGLVVTGIYDRLLFTKLPTTAFHSIAAAALVPATNFVLHHLDPECGRGARSCYYETLALNVFLYAFWSAIVLVCIDLVCLLTRRHKNSTG
jgi:hypothetical protein